MDRLEEIAARVCDLIGDRAEGECRVSRDQYGLTRFANSHIHQHHGEDTTTVAVRLAVEGRVAAASTTHLEEEDLDRLVHDTLAAARLQPIDPHWPGVSGPLEPVMRNQTHRSTIDARPDDRAEEVAAFVAAGDGLAAAGFVDTAVAHSAVATTAGLRVSGASTRSTVDGIHQTGVSAGNGHQTSVGFSDIDGAAAGRRAARLAEQGRDAVEVAPGEYPVVLSPECIATMALFLGVYGYSGRSFIDGQSFVKLGESQFDPSFSLVDDPADPRAVALGFDAEGTPKRPVVLVDDGVSRALTHDRRTAKQLEAESTGHALTGTSFGPVATNLIVGAGATAADQLVGGVDRGIYVSAFNYCRILDPRTQVVTGLTRNGTFLIENGEITRPLTNLRFTQSFLEALSVGAIAAIGDDQRYADSEFGPGLAMAPSMHLTSWNFTGGAQG